MDKELSLNSGETPAPKILAECTLSAHHNLTHSNTVHAEPHLFTGIRNASRPLGVRPAAQRPNSQNGNEMAHSSQK